MAYAFLAESWSGSEGNSAIYENWPVHDLPPTGAEVCDGAKHSGQKRLQKLGNRLRRPFTVSRLVEQDEDATGQRAGMEMQKSRFSATFSRYGPNLWSNSGICLYK